MTLNQYRIKRGWTFVQLARELGIGVEAARRRCLPPSDPLSRVPERPLMGRIWLLSGGQVPPGSFYVLPELPKSRAA